MITEDYVSFEIAKLLKEKGFDEYCTHVYNIETWRNLEANLYTSRHVYNSWLDKNEPRLMVAPTLQMALKWLREVHKLGVFPTTFYREIGGKVKHDYGSTIVRLDTFKIIGNKNFEDYTFAADTYEETAEKALKYCLENLI